jgi:maltose O-acetyltransferase
MPSPRRILGNLLFEVRAALSDLDARLLAFSACSRVLPEFSLATFRSVLFRLAGSDLRKGAVLLGRVRVVGPPRALTKLKIGARCVIGPDVTFGLDAPITLGKEVSISPGVTLFTGSHDLGPSSRRMSNGVRALPIVVEDGVWVGMNALILPGVRIGRGAVVAAGTVVHQDVEANTLVVGNPATVVRTLPLADR